MKKWAFLAGVCLTGLCAMGAGAQDAGSDEESRRFTAERITPLAHRWHLDNALIPDALIA